MTQNDTRNFKVFQASAGSGKTYTIVKEYLKLCLGSENQTDNYRHILAITFTNASANDMKAKIISHLTDIIKSKVVEENTMEADLLNELGIPDEQLKHNAQLLMTSIIHDYSSFCVSTIDAFVQKLSRAFAHDLGLPSQYTVSIDDDDVAQVITENIGMQISEDNTFIIQLLQDFSNDRFSNEKSVNLASKLNEFVKKLMEEKAYQKDGSNNIQGLVQYKETLAYLVNKAKEFEQDVKEFVERFRAVEQQYGLTVDDYWQKKKGVCSFINKLEKKAYEMPNNYFFKALENRKCLSDPSKAAANEAILNVIEPLNELFDKKYGQYLFYQSQRDLLPFYALRSKIRIEFERLAQDEEVVHISEFNKLLNHVMGDFTVPFVYERIGERIQHIFVDEFQDTSVLQWQNLIPLIDNGLASTNMSMVVGDGKQSIYRFRSGKVEQLVRLPEIYPFPEDERKSAFQSYQQTLLNNFDFHNLGTNYRSFANVVKFNNAFFQEAIESLATESQKVYVDKKPNSTEEVKIEQKTHRKNEGLVQVEMYNPDNQPDYCKERTLEIVRELTTKYGYRYEDITVLTRRTSYGSEIANYLNDNQIPVISQVSILLKSSVKVQLLINTLRYFIHNDNEAYIANILYYRRLTQQQDFDGQLSGLFKKVKDIAKGLTPLEPELDIAEVDAFATAFSKATCLFDLCATLLRLYQLDSLRDAFLNFFMEEVLKYQSNLNEGINAFLEFWEEKQDSLAVKSVSGNAVNIMTIHKSKGLEFPVVIYPEAIIDLNERLQTSKVEEEWLQPQTLGFDPIPNLDQVMFKLGKNAESMGAIARQHVENEQESNRLDNLNLLYVTFTRPVQRLYVLAKQSKTGKPNLFRDFVQKPPIPINKVLETDGAIVYCYGEADFRNPKEKPVIETEETPVDSVSGDWFTKIDVDANPSMFWMTTTDKMQPREWGELVHQILSKIQTTDDIEDALKPYLLDGSIDNNTANLLKDKFMHITRHPLIGKAFGPTAMVKNECDILSHGKIIRPDRYAELPEVIYLLDYKTGNHEEQYATQLDNYVTALREMVNKEIRAFLVYLSDSIEVVEIK